VRIGLLAPPFETVPPARYGGTERVLASLADALVERGHDVTLFAAQGSTTRARLVPTVDEPIWHRSIKPDERAVATLSIGRAFRHATDLDVMHNHMGYLALAAARWANLPTLTTVHWTLDSKDERSGYARFPEQPLVSISNAQRIPMPDAHWIATVHHGYPADTFAPSYDAGKYLAFCGRFTPEKGLDVAIESAIAAEMPIKIAARLPPSDSVNPTLRRERDYYRSVLGPYLDHPLVEYVGEITDAEKQSFFGGAAALLFPIRWPEPFGLVLIEALACGTPVIARPRGSVSEIVTHGETGFHCESVADFVSAIRKLSRIDRRACRADFEQRFLADRMAARYEQSYEMARTAFMRPPQDMLGR
jgi:glycosyltransferase involved in cell wall biosynthesis